MAVEEKPLERDSTHVRRVISFLAIQSSSFDIIYFLFFCPKSTVIMSKRIWMLAWPRLSIKILYSLELDSRLIIWDFPVFGVLLLFSLLNFLSG